MQNGHRVEHDAAVPRARILSRSLGALIVVIALAEALDLFRAVGVVLINEQLLSVVLGLALATVFVSTPARGRDQGRLPWYDMVAAIAAVGACVYVAVFYMDIMDTMFSKPLSSIVPGAVIVLAVAECLRRTAGRLLFFFLIVFIAFGLLGHLIPGHFQGRQVEVSRLVMYLGLDSNGIIGMPIAVVFAIVIPFIFFGNLLNASGGANFFTELSTALMGRYRGGSAKVAIVASTLFGSISGSAVANVVSSGVMTIPMMKRGGYPAEKAGAIEAVASTGGQLMPPMMGAAAFLMAEFLQVPFKEVVQAALIPAILYYVALFIQADIYAAREGIVGEKDIKVRAAEVLRRGWYFILPFAVIILGLFWLNLRTQTAVMWAIASLLPFGLLIGYRGVRMGFRAVLDAVAQTGLAVTQLLMVSAMAGVVIGVLNITGLGFALTQAIVDLSGGNVILMLLIAAAISIVLGMGMPTIGVYLLLATLVVPSMVEAGIPQVAAHMFAFYFGILSMITPPVAAAAFAAATIAKSDFLRTGIASVAFGWPAYLMPFIFALSPEMLWQGTPFEIGLIFVLSTTGIWLVSIGWIGWWSGAMSLVLRIGLVASGILCLVPSNIGDIGVVSDMLGLLLGAVLIVWRTISARKQQGACTGRETPNGSPRHDERSAENPL